MGLNGWTRLPVSRPMETLRPRSRLLLAGKYERVCRYPTSSFEAWSYFWFTIFRTATGLGVKMGRLEGAPVLPRMQRFAARVVFWIQELTRFQFSIAAARRQTFETSRVPNKINSICVVRLGKTNRIKDHNPLFHGGSERRGARLKSCLSHTGSRRFRSNQAQRA